jgi:hypothetical protein
MMAPQMYYDPRFVHPHPHHGGMHQQYKGYPAPEEMHAHYKGHQQRHSCDTAREEMKSTQVNTSRPPSDGNEVQSPPVAAQQEKPECARAIHFDSPSAQKGSW